MKNKAKTPRNIFNRLGSVMMLSILLLSETPFMVNASEGTVSIGAQTGTLISGDEEDSTSFLVSSVPVYAISLNPDSNESYDFIVGYSTQTISTLTINNIGSHDTGILDITLHGRYTENFALSKTSIDNITVGGSDSFTVIVNQGLSVGSYPVEVIVSGNNITSKSYMVFFYVGPIVYGVYADNGNGGGVYEAGAPVILSAFSPPNGERFKKWSISPSVIFLDNTSQGSLMVKFSMPARYVSAAATYEALPPLHHSIYISSDGNGIAAASELSSGYGTQIELTAVANNGYQFKEWQVISGGVTLSSMTSSHAFFEMQDNNVEIKAIFESIPLSVSFNVINNFGTLMAVAYGRILSSGEFVPYGEDVQFIAFPDSGYRVKEWIDNGNLVYGLGLTNSRYTISDIREHHIVTVEYEIIPVPQYAVTVDGSYANQTGAGSYSHDETVTIRAGSFNNYKFNCWTSTDNITFADARSTETTFTMPDHDVSITATWGSYTGSSEYNTSPAKPGSIGTLLAEQLENNGFFGGHNFYEKGSNSPLVHISQKSFSLFKSVTVDGNTLLRDDQYKAENGSTKVTVYADYLNSLVAGQHTITIKFTDGDDDTETFMVNEDAMKTPVLKQKQIAALFEDVMPGTWYYNDVMYAYIHNLIVGTSKEPMLFSPNTALTRGMSVTILYRLVGSPDVTLLANLFDDVADGEWYADAVKWAAQNNIVSGYNKNRFGANDDITRQDLIVLLSRYAGFSDIKLPVTREYLSFADSVDIAGYANDAIIQFYKAEVISGRTNKNFEPKGKATRAEYAAILHRFIETMK